MMTAAEYFVLSSSPTLVLRLTKNDEKTRKKKCGHWTLALDFNDTTAYLTGIYVYIYAYIYIYESI